MHDDTDHRQHLADDLTEAGMTPELARDLAARNGTVLTTWDEETIRDDETGNDVVFPFPVQAVLYVSPRLAGLIRREGLR